ncbi:NADPH:quinone reductase-like protein [Pilobolus umbonatus]|nr:NADPH:quinone reductase-like protein [Pilobolus umbonatus]
MKAITVKTPGDSSQLQIGEVSTPVPTDTQILIKVKYFALNRMDILQREGKYPVSADFSPILGVEASGVVEDVGQKVKLFKKGDEVFGLMTGGAYAQYAVMEESLTMHKPDTLSMVEAAAIPETWFTAYQALFTVGEMKKGQDVLIHAGASGVGLAAIQLAREAGAKNIFVTVGSDDKVKFCQELGARAINYKQEDWCQIIKQETSGKGVDILIDVVGKNYWQSNMDILAVDGHMVILASMSGTIIDKMDISILLRKRLRIEGSNLRIRSVEYQSILRDAVYNEVVVKHMATHDGQMKVFIDKVFPWEQIIDSHQYLESNVSKGKVVIKVTDNE